eukprot:c26338_g1_i2 orf=127-2550(+)
MPDCTCGLPKMASSLLFLSAFLTFLAAGSCSIPEELKTYIVHVSKSQIPSEFASHHQWYASALAAVKGLQLEEMEEEKHGALYAYDTVFHGFAARLTADEAWVLGRVPGFLRVFPDSVLQLHTTHTPDFMRLSSSWGLWPSSNYGEDVIVGVLDTGLWPERQSFNDEGLGPVPSRWKGECEEGTAFSASLCNKKLIGARAFYKGYEAGSGPINETEEYKSARDNEGHGSHTSSTAAGALVYNASLMGYAAGNATGMARRARLAMYKVCWAPGCYNSDILAAFDSAVADGVDIISLSVGGSVVPFFIDSIAIGSFGAMEKGILVSCSAGNSGPYPGSVTNVAPWVLTVAASTVDRDFPAPVILGDSSSYRGISLYAGPGLRGSQVPLIYARDAALNGNPSAVLCMPGTLDPNLVAGKIVLCDRGVNARVNKGIVVQQAGGAAMILANGEDSGEELTADSHVLPATLVGFKEGAAIKAYIAKTKNATAYIAFEGTQLGVKPAPIIASFSSRGPNPLPLQILKPDITAPGVNILAAWTGAVGPTSDKTDNRIVDFNIISGTSMSCPHVSGLAALLKGAHPDWSPAAIKSALMTTATIADNTGNVVTDGANSNASTPLCHGSGHVNPDAALDPGLVYDLGVQQYVDFLCSLGYKDAALEVFAKGQYSCSGALIQPGELNYPSFSVVFDPNDWQLPFTSRLTRTVTNVGAANSVYTARVISPKGVTVTVKPEKLVFKQKKESLSYEVIFEASLLNLRAGVDHVFGRLTWTDGLHEVNSPIVVTVPKSSSLATANLLSEVTADSEGENVESVQ